MSSTSKVSPDALRLVGFGDFHGAKRPPASRNPESWRREMPKLLEQVAAIAHDVRADVIVGTGDWFHSKGRSGHADVIHVIDMLTPLVEKYGPILTVAGNHDMVGNAVEHSHDEQPIGVLARAGMIRRVDVEEVSIVKGKTKYRVTGASFNLNAKAALNGIGVGGDCLVVVSHLDVTLAQAPSHLLHVNKNRNPQATLVVNGHLHEEQGCSRVVENSVPSPSAAWFNVGTMARTSAHEAGLEPKVLSATIQPGRVWGRLITLECDHASEAFVEREDDDAIEQSDRAALDEFLDSLNKEDDGDCGDIAELLRSSADHAKVNTSVVTRAVGFVSEAQSRRR